MIADTPLNPCHDSATVIPNREPLGFNIVKLIGAVTNGSGVFNEDDFGTTGQGDKISAAWIFDGVTGINARPVLDVASEPAWFVARAGKHLHEIVKRPGNVLDVLHTLVERLATDWAEATRGRDVPEGYDLPASCLTLVKWVDGRWQGLRLGDSYLLSCDGQWTNHAFPPSNLPDLEAELKQATSVRRAQGKVDMKALLDAFRPRLQTNRRNRNTPESYSILVPDASSLAMPQVMELGVPSDILICTDGFYRAVDIYGLHDDAGLVAACQTPGGVDQVLAAIRACEAADPDCQNFPRFKPADDATAVFLSR